MFCVWCVQRGMGVEVRGQLFFHVGPGYQTQVVKFDSRLLDWLSHLGNPKLPFSWLPPCLCSVPYMCTQSTCHSSHHSLKQLPDSKAVFYYHLSIQRCWNTNPVVIGMGHRQLWSCPVSAGAWGAGFSVDAWTITCWHWPYTHLFNKTQQLLIIWVCHLRELL